MILAFVISRSFGNSPSPATLILAGVSISAFCATLLALVLVINDRNLILLLDEPENNLDPKYAYLVLSLIETLVREGRGAIVSLHDLRLASRFAHRVALLSPEGVISAIGKAADVLREDTLSAVFDLSPELVRSMVL